MRRIAREKHVSAVVCLVRQIPIPVTTWGYVMGRATGTRRSRFITMAVAIVGAVVLTGAQRSCEATQSSAGAAANDAKVVANDATVEVKSGSKGNTAEAASVVQYSVSSDARIESITYLGADGDRQTQSNVSRSWYGSGPHNGRVMVRATLGDGTWIECVVKADNRVIQRARASGGGSVTVVCDTTLR